MNKIVTAVNKMIENQKKITSVLYSSSAGDNHEYFFLYDNKYKWSILQADPSNFNLFYYPGEKTTIDQLASLNYIEDNNYVVYKTSEIKTREATESFSELFTIVSSRLFGMDDVLDSIINE